MAYGHENLVPFNKRSKDEARKFGARGGKASGEARRKKADFRNTLNIILTSEVDIPEWTPILEALGLENTLETVINAAMVREAMCGNVKAYMAIKDVLGQTSKSEEDLEEQKVRMSSVKAKMGVDDEGESEDDGFLDALRGSAKDDWAEDGGGDGNEEETANI